MRRFYTILLYLALPLALLRLYWRGRQTPAYRQRWWERLAWFPSLPAAECLWLHAVSLGEVRAALPLIRALQVRYPQYPLLVTTTTPTGSRQVREALGDTVFHVYAPYDLPPIVARFLARTRPRQVIIMETELWPNWFAACAQRGIPLIVANARLSVRSARRYAWVRRLVRPLLRQATLIAAQTASDADRFRVLGAPRVVVMGNLKYDLALPEGLAEQGRVLRRQLGEHRPVWIAASTHAGEEERVLEAFEILRRYWPDLLLLLVPRHPERFAVVDDRCRRRGWAVAQRSTGERCTATTEVFLGDSLGELLLFYAAADVAFVGGSLVPVGGHNVLEPAALAVPVVVGPHTFNFTEVVAELRLVGACWPVADSEELATAVNGLLEDVVGREVAGRQGRAVVIANRGALDRLLALVESVVNDAKAGIFGNLLC